MSETHLSKIEYASLPLCEDLQRGIQAASFTFCTPIQALTLPIALAGKDVSGQAQTGTGKTAAFLIAIFERLYHQKKNKRRSSKTAIRALIVAPTRELAKQIFDDAKPLNKFLKYKLALAYGGTDYEKQRNNIEKGCDILIGTPGRIIDFYKQNCFSLDELNALVLDEADRMFDMGFIKDIRYLLKAMPAPENRQSLLFSATMSERVKELAYEHMNSPETVKVEAEQLTADKIEERAYMPANEEKIPLTIGLIKQQQTNKSIVFCNTKHKGEELHNWLVENNVKSGLLSGDVPQKKRERLLKQFKDGEIDNLVATDVAARGLHIDSVDTVINFDLPNDPEDYVHRIGRTARAGASGKAISLICETFGMNIVDIETYIDHKIEIEKEYADLIAIDLSKPKPAARKTKPHKEPKAKLEKAERHKKSTVNVKEAKPEVMPEAMPNRYMRRSFKGKEIPAIG